MTLLEDVRRLQENNRALEVKVDELESQNARTVEQVNGERGISAALKAQSREIAALRKGMYWVAGLIVASSIGFAFSVLVFIP